MFNLSCGYYYKFNDYIGHIENNITSVGNIRLTAHVCMYVHYTYMCIYTIASCADMPCELFGRECKVY